MAGDDDLATRLSGLSDAKRELLSRRLRGTSNAARSVIPRRAAGDGAVPLSFAQQRLWFLDQLEPGNAAYNIPCAGPAARRGSSRALLERSAQRAGRAGTRRCGRRSPPSTARRCRSSRRSCASRCPSIDLRALAGDEREAEARRLAGEEAQRPFDLARGPLLRATLLRLGGDEHVLLLTMHHIVSDGWSMGVFVRELAALYAAYRDGGRLRRCPSCRSSTPTSPCGSASGCRARSWSAQLDYWRRAAGAISPTLELPTDRPRPPVQSFRGADVPLSVPAQLTERCAALGRRRRDVTLFMTVLAAFQIAAGALHGTGRRRGRRADRRTRHDRRPSG